MKKELCYLRRRGLDRLGLLPAARALSSHDFGHSEHPPSSATVFYPSLLSPWTTRRCVVSSSPPLTACESSLGRGFSSSPDFQTSPSMETCESTGRTFAIKVPSKVVELELLSPIAKTRKQNSTSAGQVPPVHACVILMTTYRHQ